MTFQLLFKVTFILQIDASFDYLCKLFSQDSIAAPAPTKSLELDPTPIRAENLTAALGVEDTTWIINLTIAFLRIGRTIVLQR